MIKKRWGWPFRSQRKPKPIETLIWQSFSEPQHFLILLPKNRVWGVDTFHFLRVSLDPSQIGIEMRFRHSQKLPWLDSCYGPTCSTLNPLAEAVVKPLEQYLQARSAGHIEAIDQFHSLMFRLHENILNEIALLAPPESGYTAQPQQGSVDYSDMENMLDAFDRSRT
ncbi:hypothetical protein C1752_01906 [Acaryochloris thomasi RCC1774]|uniref:Uncharacterized protein n=1 Tax=Acaryochloris thomasi RCC1774 TaxID=1764569 RepID=A0A2W1JK50_9CYAN|nr:hypothetical protein [Acaryochloris thomasi]PZD73606.1 hypothetical protein C1752_01906 [Acaryochloris thomasi RCC1774]